ncbi:MAG TPA: TIGR04283 family arsenosugar biosynthesis glycosyltransferase [Burkholderiales bacterium]|nr:TIGR04283 family arsenosugar biosynthesis glycosyltransferase [Burkholderiales bacterium]
MKLSVVIPVLDEAAGIRSALQHLQPLRAIGHEVILIDGGSRDATFELAEGFVDSRLRSKAGRAVQMNAGARVARGEVLLFLHADTRLPVDAVTAIANGLPRSGRAWGRFDVRIDGEHRLLQVVACAMNLRSRLTSICTGDQTIFVRRDLFERVGGFPQIELMEDIALSRRLRGCSPPLALREAVITSARRWEKRGVWRTIMLMWWLRLRFFFGASPAALRRAYDDEAK